MGQSIGLCEEQPPGSDGESKAALPPVTREASLKKGNEATTSDVFVAFARLGSESFFKALQAVGLPDISSTPFASVIFRDYCENNDVALGVGMQGWQLAVLRGKAMMETYQAVATSDAGVLPADLPALFEKALQFLAQKRQEVGLPEEVQSMALPFIGKPESRAYMEEVFARYDLDSSGTLDLSETLTMGLTLIALMDAYYAIGGNEPLTQKNYNGALAKIGFADAYKLMQGILFEGVFDRFDCGGDGTVDLPEFWAGTARMLRPIVFEKKLLATKGWPGWGDSPAELAEQISTLRTGDVVLVKIDDAMGRYLQFSLNSPYNHLAVVVRHAARPGIPNEHTEELLQRFPFRRRSHQFCNPGYCRCFDTSWEHKFGPSKLAGVGISLLESTGEGIHVYDFAHRFYESAYGKGCSVVAVRRLKDVDNRDDVARVERFIQTVRGKLYTTHAGELRDAILSQADTEHEKKLHNSSAFCSKIVSAFYRHMGWLSDDHSINIMPCDWDEPDGNHMARPLKLSQGSLSPVEIIKGRL